MEMIWDASFSLFKHESRISGPCGERGPSTLWGEGGELISRRAGLRLNGNTGRGILCKKKTANMQVMKLLRMQERPLLDLLHNTCRQANL